MTAADRMFGMIIISGEYLRVEEGGISEGREGEVKV
jgi:hypothetical protein